MFDIVPDALVQLILRLLLGLLRLMWFMTWQLWVEWIFWSIGWAALRLLTFGRYPSYAAFEYEKNVPFWTHFFVCVVGAGTLGSAIYIVMQLL